MDELRRPSDLRLRDHVVQAPSSGENNLCGTPKTDADDLDAPGNTLIPVLAVELQVLFTIFTLQIGNQVNERFLTNPKLSQGMS